MLQNIAEDYEFLMILVLCTTFIGTGALVSWFFTKPSNTNLLRSADGIVPAFIGLPAVLFSLTAALMATSLWENYSVAIKAVRNESQSIATIIELADTIPNNLGQQLKQNAKAYAQSVVTDEWPTLSHSAEASPVTQQRFNDLMTTAFATVDSLKGAAKASALMNAFQNTNNGRKTRLSFVSFDVHPIRWFAMLTLAILLQISTALVHVATPRALRIAVGVSTIIVLVPICTIAFTLGSPYVGVISISNAPFLAILR